MAKCAAPPANDLRCGICLELFKDPRSLPCLHTFCFECLQQSLGNSHSLKCPVCRAKHELSPVMVKQLPVDQYAVQELPLKRLQELSGKQLCKSCGEQGALVAWCEDCSTLICQTCVSLHHKIAVFQKHTVVTVNEPKAAASLEKHASCLIHTGQKLKYLCTRCSEMVCPECLLLAHKNHDYIMVDKARHSLETKMKDLASSVTKKKQDFSDYLKRLSKVENKALEHSELIKSEVNNVFDRIAASVEAQRNEALQSVSQRVKKIWSQKEMMEVSLAQLDSFTRFADHAHKCTTDGSYVAMATQGIKLMEQLKDTNGDESVLKQKMMSVGSMRSDKPLNIPLAGVFTLGQPTLSFDPVPGSTLAGDQTEISIRITLTVGGVPLISRENFQLTVEAEHIYDMTAERYEEYDSIVEIITRKVTASIESHEFSWVVSFRDIDMDISGQNCDDLLEVKCLLSGDLQLATETTRVKYYIDFVDYYD